MNIPLRLAIIALLALFGVALFKEAGKLSTMDTPDPSRVAIVFVLIILVALAIGGMIALSLAPALGEKIGGFFFNPDGKIEKDVRSKALAAITRGEYETAIREFEKVLAHDPLDTISIHEIVQLLAVKLEQPIQAAEFLELRLQQEWPPEHTAFLASRLVDIYWTHLHDAERARAVLLQIVEAMPDSRHAANARRRLSEIERALGQESVRTPPFLDSNFAEDPASDESPDPSEHRA